ncbi:MAG: hypothetical protein ACAI25_04610, partial [Planctomycetota bacterium]
MKRSRWIHGMLAVVGALFLAGCGAALTGVVGGALFATKSGGGGGGAGAQNTASTIPTAVVTSNSGAGTVVFSFAVTDAESDTVEVEVRYSSDPNDSATTAFPNIATGTIADALGAAVAATQVPTTSSGISYTFSWNTAQDLGAVKVDNVRLQVLLRQSGSSSTFAVANTSSTFVIDNTKAPIIVSATLGALPSGATIYADEQANRGFIPVTVVLADAESTTCSLRAFFSLDGGVTFPSQNAAAGLFVDSSGTVQPPDQLNTSPGGTVYTFRFNSAASGLGVNGGQSTVLQFQASDSKSSAPRNAVDPQSGSTTFGVNNASFNVILNTPSGSQVTDKVVLPYRLVDSASQGLDVQVRYMVPGPAGPRMATPVPQPPHTGTNGLSSSPGGSQHFFVWNAFYDMVVVGKQTTSSGITMDVTVTRPSTQVKKGPFPTGSFSVDHRLIETVFNKAAGVVDDVPATQQGALGTPGNLCRFGVNLYICDEQTNRVRALDLTTGKLSTVLGGGATRADGVLGTDYALGFPTGIAASTAQGGTLFVTEIVSDPTNNNFQIARFLRVDGSTPVVTSFGNLTDRNDRVITMDQMTDTVFLEFNFNGKRIMAFPANGQQGMQTIVGGGPNSPDDIGTPMSNSMTRLGDNEACGGAVDTSRFGTLFLVSERNNGRVLGVNYGNSAITAYGKTIPAFSTCTLITGLQKPRGLAIVTKDVPGVVSPNDLAVVEEQGQRVSFFRVSDGAPTGLIIGSAAGVFGFAGEGDDPSKALLVFPQFITAMDNVSNDIVAVADTNLGRVRALKTPVAGFPDGTFVTIAGGAFVTGDGTLAATALMRVPNGVAPLGSDILVVDPILSTVRKVDRTTWTIDRVAGTGAPGVSGDGGLAIDAAIGLPNSIITTPAGDYYVSQLSTSVVRHVDANGIITTVAGTGAILNGNPVPDNGNAIATSTPLNNPSSLSLNGTLLTIAQTTSLVFVANLGPSPQTIASIPIGPGCIARVGGDATLTASVPVDGADARATSLISPEGATFGSGSPPEILVCDSQWCAIFRIDGTTGKITTIAGIPDDRGFEDGPAALAKFDQPSGLYFDAPRNVIYIQDSRNGAMRVFNRNAFQVTLHGVDIPGGHVGTVAGFKFGPPDIISDNGLAVKANVRGTQGIGASFFVDAAGNLIFCDGDSARVRRVDTNGIIYTVAGLGLVDDAEPGTGQLGRPAENATLRNPTALVALKGGAYYVIDSGRIRRVDPDTTRLTRLGGVGQQQAFGDGGSLALASFANRRSLDALADVTSEAIG